MSLDALYPPGLEPHGNMLGAATCVGENKGSGVLGNKSCKHVIHLVVGDFIVRPAEVLIGQFREELARRIKEGEETVRWLMENYKLDEYGANSLISYVNPKFQ